jgi:hypothetical protein
VASTRRGRGSHLIAGLRLTRQPAQELGQCDTKSDAAGLDPAEMIRILHEGRRRAASSGKSANWRPCRDADNGVSRGVHSPRARFAHSLQRAHRAAVHLREFRSTRVLFGVVPALQPPGGPPMKNS